MMVQTVIMGTANSTETSMYATFLYEAEEEEALPVVCVRQRERETRRDREREREREQALELTVAQTENSSFPENKRPRVSVMSVRVLLCYAALFLAATETKMGKCCIILWCR